MPAQRKATSTNTSSATTPGFEAVAKYESGRARVEVKQARPFDIRNAAFGISPADTFEQRRVNP